MSSGPWKVGSLAKLTGVTVRTLHHYDEIGLLKPSHHSDTGHRLYTKSDLEQLQKILSLRQLGFTLEEVAQCLTQPRFALLHVVQMHIGKISEQLESQNKLLGLLKKLAERLTVSGEVPDAQLLEVLEGTTMIEKYYTKAQLKELDDRKQQLGAERINEVEAEWPRLMEEVRKEMEAGTNPKDPAVRALARRWAALIQEFTGGKPELERSLKSMYQSEPSAPVKFGMPQDMMKMAEYIRLSPLD